MKSLLVVLAAVGAARGAVTCDECRAGAQDFVAHLLSQEGITEQTDEMKSKVCPQVMTTPSPVTTTDNTTVRSLAWRDVRRSWTSGTQPWLAVFLTILSWKLTSVWEQVISVLR